MLIVVISFLALTIIRANGDVENYKIDTDGNDTVSEELYKIEILSEDDTTKFDDLLAEDMDDYVSYGYNISSEDIEQIKVILNSRETYNYVFSGAYEGLTETKLMYRVFDWIKISFHELYDDSSPELIDNQLDDYFQTEEFYNMYVNSKINESINLYTEKREMNN